MATSGFPPACAVCGCKNAPLGFGVAGIRARLLPADRRQYSVCEVHKAQGLAWWAEANKTIKGLGAMSPQSKQADLFG